MARNKKMSYAADNTKTEDFKRTSFTSQNSLKNVVVLARCTPRSQSVRDRMPVIIDCQNDKDDPDTVMLQLKHHFDCEKVRHDSLYEAVQMAGDKRNNSNDSSDRGGSASNVYVEEDIEITPPPQQEEQANKRTKKN
jgi:hypothetical protein